MIGEFRETQISQMTEKADPGYTAEQLLKIRKYEQWIADMQRQEAERIRNSSDSSADSEDENYQLDQEDSQWSEGDLVNKSYPEYDARRWIKLVESESEDTVAQYYNNLGLSDEMLSQKERILDIGSSVADFAAHCKSQGINNEVVSLEPHLMMHPGFEAAHKMYWGDEVSEHIKSRTIAGTMEKLPLKDASIDLIVVHAAMPGFQYSFYEVDHMKDGICDAFNEIMRVLKVGGEARMFPLPNLTTDERSQWRPNIENKLSEMEKAGICNVQIENVFDSENGELLGERVVLRKI